MATQANRRPGSQARLRTPDAALAEVREEIEQILQRPLSPEHLLQPLVELGLDSFSAISLQDRLATRFGEVVDLPVLLDCCTVTELASTVGGCERGKSQTGGAHD